LLVVVAAAHLLMLRLVRLALVAVLVAIAVQLLARTLAAVHLLKAH